jgi:integrase
METKYKVKEEIKYMSSEQIKRFFRHIRDNSNFPARDRAMFLTIYRYGLRVSEATLLKVEDVNFREGTIYLRRVKSGISTHRTLFPDVKRALTAYLPKRTNKGNNLFTGRRGGLGVSMIEKLFKTHVSGKFTVHSLRHTCAVHALDAGLDVRDVQALLGHKRIQSTVIYASISDKRKKQADDLLTEAFDID